MTAAKSVKQPTDRKPKDDKPKVDTVEIEVGEGKDKRTIPARRVAIRGVVVTVPDEAVNDFEVLDDIRAVQDQDDASRLPALLRRLVGDADYRRVMDALRGANGRVAIDVGSEFVLELFQALNPSA
jgi:hypothetical protein